MRKKGERIYPIGPYPTDSRGISLPIQEVDERFYAPNLDRIPKSEVNNHHRNYFAKNFGRFVISKTFRDLESQQIEMVIWRHNLLHDLYLGFEIPEPKVMMEEIEADMQEGKMLKIYHDEDPDNKGYQFEPITEEKWLACKKEYNKLALDALLATIPLKR